ncbi:MAG: helix-turn-helix transcriptional regulator, partial [Halothiobacillus sp.]|nr:helix-turn-helix transcriptional regulator [Halothiobacillus sp.]
AGTMNRTPDTLEQKLLANPEVQAAYDELTPEYALARELIAARVRAGLSQSQLAERMNTKQSTIARLESGKALPSMRTLHRIAEATNSRASVTLTSR